MQDFKLATAIFLAIASQAVGQTGFWTSSIIPGTKQVTNDTASVTLGLKFYSDVPGTITGVRFYKGSSNTGTHVGTQAAGAIHTDFEKGFIRAETISYDDYIANNGETGAKEAGKMRLEGKDYVVADGDVMHFRFAT